MRRGSRSRFPHARLPEFSRAVLLAEFGRGQVISDETLLAGILRDLDLPPELLECREIRTDPRAAARGDRRPRENSACSARPAS